jgi:fructokinase
MTGGGSFVSRVGNDDEGKVIRDILKRRNINDSYVQTDAEHPTGAAIPQLNEDKVPVWKIETGCAYDFIESTGELEDLVNNKTDCLYFGTLAQRDAGSRNTIQSLFGLGGLTYFCDLNIRQNFYSKEVIEKSLYVAHVLKLNTDELKIVNDMFLQTEYNIEDTALKLKEKFNIELLCVTKGSGGALLFGNGGKNEFQYKADKVIDTVGAGDAYAAVLCIGFLNGWDIERINETACEFAAEIVKVNGALPADDTIYRKFEEMINNEQQ